ncbi:MAG: SIMPL domain-containing protein [Chloroflexota bacterium]|nr:SIMPL domain-containing protein [Chloroflexota bacterium]
MKRNLMLAAALALLIAVGPSVALAQEAPMTNTITVTGAGSASGEPDTAFLQLGVERLDADLGVAFSETGTVMRAVIDAVVALGIDRADIQTTGINVYPQDRYDASGANPTRAFQVSNVVQVKVRDVSQVEAVISAAVAAGANTLYNLTFGIEDSTALAAQARLDAVADGRARAEQLAAALGVTVGRPLAIREVIGGNVPSPYMGGGMAMADMAAAQPVSQGQLSIGVTVEITFALE